MWYHERDNSASGDVIIKNASDCSGSCYAGQSDERYPKFSEEKKWKQKNIFQEKNESDAIF